VGTIRKPESISKLAKLTATTLSLPASTLNIGGQQYNTLTALTLNTATVGAGGVDVTVVANSVYYVYAVVSSNTVYLIGSLSSSVPSGFMQARKVGAFTTGVTSQILEAFYYGQVMSPGEWMSYTPSSSGPKVDSILTKTGKYKRSTDSMEVSVSATVSTIGVGASTMLSLGIPSGFTLDTLKLALTASLQVLGSVQIRNAGTTIYYTGHVLYSNTTTVGFINYDGSGGNYMDAIRPITWANGDAFTAIFKLPIAEWSGSGTQFVW